MAPAARYFELLPHVGIEPDTLIDPSSGEPVDNPKAGELQPLQHLTLTIAVPTMVDEQLVALPQTVTVDAIPGTRILKIDDPVVADAVSTHPLYREIDAPTRKSLAAAREQTHDARERPASGDPDTTTARPGQEG